jgi:hypothetical protein
VVLAQKVGKKRSFGTGIVLSAVTFLVYSIFWNYRAHDEVYRQFELQKEGRDEGIIWLAFGIVFLPLFLAYGWIMASNVQYVRHRMRLPQGIGPGGFVGRLAAAMLSYGALVVVVTNAATVTTADPARQRALDVGMSVLAVLFLLAMFFLAGSAYRRLQRDVNELWDAYDARLAELQAPATATTAGPVMAPWALRPPGWD